MIENQFDALLTFDKNLQFQQNFAKYSISVLVLNTPDNSYMTLKNMVQKIEEVLRTELKNGPMNFDLEPADNLGAFVS